MRPRVQCGRPVVCLCAVGMIHRPKMKTGGGRWWGHCGGQQALQLLVQGVPARGPEVVWVMQILGVWEGTVGTIGTAARGAAARVGWRTTGVGVMGGGNTRGQAVGSGGTFTFWLVKLV